jgi:fatty-acyl-CoA synthase
MVVLKEGRRVAADEIIDHLKDSLAKYKIPKSIVYIDQLPRNAAGKVLKNVTREEHS